MIQLKAASRSLACALALVASSATTQSLTSGLADGTSQRAGTLNLIDVNTRTVVIDDRTYRLSPSARLTSAVTRGDEKKVNYTVVGEGGGQLGTVVLITPAKNKKSKSRE